MHLLVRLKSILALYKNELAQVRIGHVACGGFVTGAIFVMGISGYYLRKKRDQVFAARSFAIACMFGLIAALGSFYFGDENGALDATLEPEKLAAIEAQWQTQPAPASWLVFAIPDQAHETNHFEVKVPYLLSLIVTRSLDGTVEGMQPLMARNIEKIKTGIQAYQALHRVQMGKERPGDLTFYQKNKHTIGFGLLAKKYQNDLTKPVSDAVILKASRDSIPHAITCFFTFRIMIAIWGLLMFLFVRGLYLAQRRRLATAPIYLTLCTLAIPLPIVAAWCGWMLSEIGRQPWIIHGYLPTFMGASSLSAQTVMTSIVLYALFYAGLFVVELWLMCRIARKGPSSLGTKRYHFEQEPSA